jgi:alginate O-acetyltransferase complex protein AlgI
MLFNSIDFAIFLPLVFAGYWLIGRLGLKSQNLFILAASYFFYGWWDWRFLSLVLFSTLVDYSVGRGLASANQQGRRQMFLATSIILNLGLLGVFKYMNFFLENYMAAFTLFGYDMPYRPLNIILPVGISFYTFQTISYSIDVYKRKLEPVSDLVAFAAYVSFFPQLVAGPIERATTLLPQFFSKRKFIYSDATDGLRQMLWGLFKKVVIADNCAVYVDMVFGDPDSYHSGTLLFAALLFPLQVYGDFSGYSDIAIGTARLFGIRLSRNFAFPFFTTTVAEFWRRWHMTLYSWFRDYVFYPEVFKYEKRNKWVVVRASFIVFALIGFWHGADWTFIIWGLINAVYVVIPIMMGKSRSEDEFVKAGNWFPSWRQGVYMIRTYLLVSITAVLFRAQDVSASIHYFRLMFEDFTFGWPEDTSVHVWVLILFFQITEWFGRGDQYAIQRTLGNRPVVFRWLYYVFIICMIGMFMQTMENPFVYFNF